MDKIGKNRKRIKTTRDKPPFLPSTHNTQPPGEDVLKRSYNDGRKC